MPRSESRENTGLLEINGKSYSVDSVIADYHQRYFDVGGDFIPVDFAELDIRKKNGNLAFVKIDNRWISGITTQKRWNPSDSKSERLTIFTSDDKTVTFIARSSPVTY